jgi:hypothetical protein
MHFGRRRLRWLSATAVLSLVGSLMWSAPAQARVSVTPATWTPAVTSPDATVRQLVQCGTTMFAVGSFSQVTQGGHTYTRKNAFSFNANTGAVTTWNPNVNGEVNSVALTRNCKRAFLGGEFTFLRGRTVENLAALSATTAKVIMSFGHTVNRPVDTLALVQRRTLMVGGNFTVINGTKRGDYASVSWRTGDVTSYFKLAITGVLPGKDSKRMVYNSQVSRQGDRLLIEGDFTKIGTHHREQVAEFNLGPGEATLNGFGNELLSSKHCLSDEAFYVRSAAFSEDEKTIYLAATGKAGASPYCDAVSALANTPRAATLWVNKTGGDSLYSVAAGASSVYIAGHERWADNPDASNSCGTGCVPRPGIGAIGTASGLATSWNPTRARGHGADDLVVTTRGLWVASDTFFGAVDCGGVSHPGICFFHGVA